jgi:hypothetical protein
MRKAKQLVNAGQDVEESEVSSVRQQALARLKRAQLRLPRHPVNVDGSYAEPDLPPDITALAPQELGTLHGQLAAMAAYAGAASALAAVDLVDKQRALRTEKARAHLLARTQKTQDERRAQVELTERVQLLAEQECVAQATRDLMQSVYDGYIVRKEACSREMTRRIDLRDREPR